MSNRVTNDRLAQGIAAAKAGDRAGARVHFEAAAEQRPGDPVCWVWLAWTAPTPADAVFDLQKAASLAPDAGIVWKGLEFAQVLASSPKLDRSLGRGRSRPRSKGRPRSTPRPSDPQPAPSAPGTPPAASAPAPAPAPAPTLTQRPVPTLAPMPVLASATPASVFAPPPARPAEPAPRAEERPAAPLQERVIPWDDSTPRDRLPEFRDRGDKPADWARSAVAPSTGFGPTSVTAVAPTPRAGGPRIEAPRSSDGIAAAAAEDGERKPHILVVDDSPTVCRVVTIALSNRGFEVTSANDGVEAITMVSQRKPDLVLLDITMPKLDGYKVCKLIRGRKETREVPIVMLSGNDGFFDQARGKFAGCTSFLSKPFEPDDLIKEVEKQLAASMAGAAR